MLCKNKDGVIIVAKLDRKDCFIMKAKKTILTLLLCIGLVLSVLVGCGTDDGNSKENNGNENVTTDGILEKDNADTDEVESVEDDMVIVEDDFDGIPCKDCKIMGVEFTPITTTFDEFMESHPELICISEQKYNSADVIVPAGKGAMDVIFKVRDIDEYTYISISFKNTTDAGLRLGDCIMCRDFNASVDATKPETAKQYPLMSINGLTIGDVFASVDDLNAFVGMEYETVFDRANENHMTYRYLVNECYFCVDLNIDTGTIVGLSYLDKINFSE